MAVLLVGGCGNAKRSDEEQVRDTASHFARAFTDRDFAKACGMITSEAKERLATVGAALGGEGRCVPAMRVVYGQLDHADLATFRAFKIRTVTIDGSSATVKLASGKQGTQLHKKSGAWLVEFPGAS